jgi:hypothetical protein
VGYESAGFPDRGYVAIPNHILQVWRENKREESFCEWMKRAHSTNDTTIYSCIYLTIRLGHFGIMVGCIMHSDGFDLDNNGGDHNRKSKAQDSRICHRLPHSLECVYSYTKSPSQVLDPRQCSSYTAYRLQKWSDGAYHLKPGASNVIAPFKHIFFTATLEAAN